MEHQSRHFALRLCIFTMSFFSWCGAFAATDTKSQSPSTKLAAGDEASVPSKVSFEDNEYSCKIADQRRIAVIYEKKGSPLPCRVLYSRDPASGKYTEIRRARHEENNCEQKAREVARKFENAGWRCEHSLRSIESAKSSLPVVQDDVAPQIVTEPATNELPRAAVLSPAEDMNKTSPSRNPYKYSVELDGRFATESKDVSYDDSIDKTQQTDLQFDLDVLVRFGKSAVGPILSITSSNAKNSLTQSNSNSNILGLGLAWHYKFDNFQSTSSAPFVGLYLSRDLAKASDKLFDLNVRSSESAIKLGGQLGVKSPVADRLDLKAFVNIANVIFSRSEKQARVGSASGTKINIGFGLAWHI